MIIIDHLQLNSPADSNLFLRALWASLRNRFERLGWQYTPRKFGPQQRIRFGWMSLGSSAPTGVEVSIRYGKVGVIKAIEFELKNEIAREHPDIEQILRTSAKEAFRRKDSPEERFLASQVASSPSVALSYYRGRNWYCGPLTNGHTELGISVKGFDDADRQHEFAIRLAPLLDILSCLTNVAFEQVNCCDGEPSNTAESKNQFLIEDEWLDDFPVEDGCLRISERQLQFCEDFVDGLIGDDRLTRAASIFHKALVIYQKLPEGHDVAMALFVSSLEAVDLPLSKPNSCQECGQTQYKISQRVVDLAEKHLGPGVKKILKDSYNRRSKYLHAGKVLSSQPMTSHIIPQLSPDGIEGCATPAGISSPRNLMEFTSFIIRRELLFNDPRAHGGAEPHNGFERE